MIQFDTPFEPVGDAYFDLLRGCRPFVDRCSLVIPPEWKPRDDHGRAVMKDLEPWVIERKLVDRWPGTQVHGKGPPSHELVYLGPFDRVLGVLIDAHRCLYSWRSPWLPEDLALYRKDGSLLLGSIAHEHDWWLELREQEAEQLLPLFVKRQSTIRVDRSVTGRVMVRGDELGIIELGRSLQEHPEGAGPIVRESVTDAGVRIVSDPAMDKVRVRSGRDFIEIAGSASDLDIVSAEIFSFVTETCMQRELAGGLARCELLNVQPHPYLTSDSDSIVIEMVRDVTRVVGRE